MDQFEGASAEEVEIALRVRHTLGEEELQGKPRDVAGDLMLVRYARAHFSAAGRRGGEVQSSAGSTTI